MALRRDVTYSGRFTPATTERPQGGFKNRTSPTSEDGSYLEEQWLNDIDGFFGSLLNATNTTPNGNVDEAGNSQLFDAATQLFSQGWSANVNYGIGQEVVHNGLRYIARVASGPDNGGAQQPDPTLVEYWFEIPSVGTRAFEFLSVPVGMELAFDTPPPADDPRFRFVKLTADDAYNGSLLNNKVISGTAPNLVVKMTVNSALSPINGQQVSMLNTMGAIHTPGLTSGVIIQDAIRNITGSIVPTFDALNSTYLPVWDTTGNDALTHASSGLVTVAVAQQPGTTSTARTTGIKFDASRVVPTAERVKVFAETRVYYKRIY